MQCFFTDDAKMRQTGPITRDTQQTQTHHQHAGDGTTAESHIHGGTNAAPGRFGGAHVGAYRNIHADVAGGTGQHGTDHESDRRTPSQKDADQHEQDHANHTDGQVLTIEVGARAFLDGIADFLHARVARGLRQNPACRDDAIKNGEKRASDRQNQSVLHKHCNLPKNVGCPLSTTGRRGDARTGKS
ncbi:MAG: hypothetical protein BWZ07_02319 [Alphaproteobacteria bacterium ADurb.BinA280]|nr:MAG: hypothetical protein BWZ07_02319 [Alphaproteobacteria bacterium ADurb.BinA280]